MPADDGSPSIRAVPDPCPYSSQRATPTATPRIDAPAILTQPMPIAGHLTMPAFVVRGSRRLALIPERGPPEIPTTSS